MTRILFITPPNLTFEDYVDPPANTRHVAKPDGRVYGNLATDMPLGILSLSAFLKAHTSVDARLIDFNLELNDLGEFAFGSYAEFFTRHLQEHIGDFAPDIIGISSLFTPSFFSLIQLGDSCRAVFPDALIVAGGSVPSSMYAEILQRTTSFDALCYGEGEIPLLSLVVAHDRKAQLENDSSWITIRKHAAGAAFMHQFVEQLDDIPFYDYELCDMRRYGSNAAMTAYAAVKDKSLNHFQVMTSRGCPFKCTFCASHRVHGRKMRYYSTQRVRDDFKRLKERYGAETLVFQDDHFMGDRKRALEIIDIVRQLDLTAVFQNGLALYALDREVLEALKAAGVNQLVLAVESGSDRVLRHVMRKPLKLSIVQRVANDCRDLGIYSSVNVLIGMPGETPRDIEDARAFLRTIDANWFIVLAASPLVGSEMYEICESKGYLKDGYLGSDYKRAVVETEDFSATYIQDTLYDLNLDLNFVNNADLRLGNYAVALKGFENAIRARNDHALAYHFAAHCLRELGETQKAEQYAEQASRIAVTDPYWRRYFERFSLPLPDTSS